MLPDRSLLIGQKLVENAKIEKLKCDILGDFTRKNKKIHEKLKRKLKYRIFQPVFLINVSPNELNLKLGETETQRHLSFRMASHHHHRATLSIYDTE